MKRLIPLFMLPAILIAAESPATSTDNETSVEAPTEAASSQAPQSQDVITQVRDSSLGLTIKGNQELPNVLYIVPWKKGVKNDVSPIQGRIVEEVYGPTEMSVFKRRVRLYRAFNQTPVQSTDESNSQ